MTKQFWIFIVSCIFVWCKALWKHQSKFYIICVATLALGSQLRQGLARVWTKKASPRVTSHALGNVGECEGMNPHTPKWIPILRIQVPMDSQIFSEQLQGSKFIELRSSLYHQKVLECICLKWACMTHLDTSNTNYGQKKGRESNWQFDSRPLKVKNRPNFLAYRWRATCHSKAFNKGYNFPSNLIPIEGFHTKLWAPKVEGVPTLEISRLPFGSPGTKWVFPQV
jgi:hypothetical protein